IDNLIQRKNHTHEIIRADHILKADNPAGCITDDLWETIGQALELSDNGECYVIEVAGEEDLAVLPCILMANPETTILYGQPNEGLVLLKARELKNKAQMLIDGFIE
ncbi:MAG: GTP-dependent dephospho-CoA kinase family protein, partial [Methanobrevibacter sp.]|nr:GTP-dependent dephospho-CoA kinase family protein [Methanobrevibacter sp.]